MLHPYPVLLPHPVLLPYPVLSTDPGGGFFPRLRGFGENVRQFIFIPRLRFSFLRGQ